MTEFSLIVKSLLRAKVVPILIVLQLGLSVAIVSNITFFIVSRAAEISKPTGIDHEQLGRIQYKHDNDALLHSELVSQDLNYLRSRNDVHSVTPISAVPLSNSGSNTKYKASLSAEVDFDAQTMFGDEMLIKTLGVKVLEGRDFYAVEAEILKQENMPTQMTAIISQSMAETLYPNESAIGKQMYSGGTGYNIIAVVSDSLGYWPTWEYTHNMVYLVKMPTWRMTYYLIKSDSTELETVLSESLETLKDLEFERSVSLPVTLSSLLRRTYNNQYSMIYILSIVAAMLVMVNILGIFGLTTFWVSQRKKQIGIRRALGASKAVITQYFLVENAIIVVAATVFGGLIAYSANGYLMKTYAIQMLPLGYVPVAGALTLLVTLAAAYSPARKAAEVSAIEAVAE
ncbi:MAG: putative ABC transport system permease protein [Flavobacteriales bacterium]|jgi:putative ABC transport system permease protein